MSKQQKHVGTPIRSAKVVEADGHVKPGMIDNTPKHTRVAGNVSVLTKHPAPNKQSQESAEAQQHRRNTQGGIS